jgi:hypothetical protein
MSSGSLFTAQIGAFVEKAKGNTELVLRKVALEMFTRVVIKSPVDEGRFKSSWLVAINSVPQGVPGTIDKTGAPSFERIQATVPLTKVGDTITMVSNLPYSQKLEYGHSSQAPSGVIRVTIMEWNNVVSNAAQAVNK